jgi:hypothetical protein
MPDCWNNVIRTQTSCLNRKLKKAGSGWRVISRNCRLSLTDGPAPGRYPAPASDEVKPIPAARRGRPVAAKAAA